MRQRFLLLQYVGSIEAQYDCWPDVGWMASSAVLLRSCRLSAVLRVSFCGAVLFPSFLAVIFFLLVFSFIDSYFLFFLFFTQVSLLLVCWLA